MANFESVTRLSASASSDPVHHQDSQGGDHPTRIGRGCGDSRVGRQICCNAIANPAQQVVSPQVDLSTESGRRHGLSREYCQFWCSGIHGSLHHDCLQFQDSPSTKGPPHGMVLGAWRVLRTMTLKLSGSHAQWLSRTVTLKLGFLHYRFLGTGLLPPLAL